MQQQKGGISVASKSTTFNNNSNSAKLSRELHLPNIPHTLACCYLACQSNGKEKRKGKIPYSLPPLLLLLFQIIAKGI